MSMVKMKNVMGLFIGNRHQKQKGDVNSDREVFTQAKSMEEEEDEHEEKLVRHVRSVNDFSSLTEFAAIVNPTEHQSSNHELFEEAWKMQIEGEQTRIDRHA